MYQSERMSLMAATKIISASLGARAFGDEVNEALYWALVEGKLPSYDPTERLIPHEAWRLVTPPVLVATGYSPQLKSDDGSSYRDPAVLRKDVIALFPHSERHEVRSDNSAPLDEIPWHFCEAMAWFVHRNQQKVNKTDEHAKQNPRAYMIHLLMDKPDTSNPWEALQEAAKAGEIRVYARRTPAGDAEQVSLTDLAELKFDTIDGPTQVVLIPGPHYRPRFYKPVFLKRDVIRHWPATFSVSNLPKPKRGPKAAKLEETISQMQADISNGSMTINQLAEMREKAMETRYGVSRDTARKARISVLTKFGAISENSDTNQPTNDK